MSSVFLYHVDAFTSSPFKGNPAGVCLLDSLRSDLWMQSVAAEMRMSETAFLLPEADGYRLRWFTPSTEVRLCGHATLASAYILYETHCLPSSEIVHFHTRSGLLTAWRENGGISLDFPAGIVEPAEAPAGLLDALGVQNPIFVGRKINSESYLIEIAGADTITGLAPDFARLMTTGVRAVTVTARGDGRPYDFVSRYFAPKVGVNEDPVTGSAHCNLATYWHQRLNKTTFLAYQSSSRGGELRIHLEGERVILTGQAVAIFKAHIDIEDF